MELKKIKKWNNKAWTIRDLIPSLIVFGLVVSIFYLMIQREADNYLVVGGASDIIDPNFQAHYGDFQQHVSKINQMVNLTNSPSGFTLIGSLGTMFQAMLGVFRLIFDTIAGLGSQFNYLLGDFGDIIPSEIMGLLITAVLAGLAVLIVLIVLNSAKYGRL